MPNFAAVLKDEIARLARKELRRELEGLKKSSSQYRSEIAALKRNVAMLEKQLARLRKSTGKGSDSGRELEEGTSLRFSAKGLLSQRKRLGLSASDMGILLGVSAQTVYNWETGKTRPRPQQLESIAVVKKMGKRQVRALLTERGVEG